jgi:hypothetical protein
MKTLVGQIDNMPKPHPRYAQMAAAMRATGLNIKDTDFERIDALLEKNRGGQNPEDSRDADIVELSIATALRESGCMSQDFKDADPVDSLIAGYLPQAKTFLVN